MGKKILIGLCVIFLIFAGISYYSYRKVTNYVIDLASSAPVEIKKIAISEEEFLNKRRSLSTFLDELKSGVCKGEYSLTGEEVNALIKDVDDKIFTKWIYGNIKDSKIDVSFSIPLISLLDTKIFKDKFLNGILNFEMRFDSKNPNFLEVKVNNVDFNSKQIPFLKDWQKIELKNNMKKSFESVENIILEGDKLIVKCKENPNK